VTLAVIRACVADSRGRARRSGRWIADRRALRGGLTPDLRAFAAVGEGSWQQPKTEGSADGVTLQEPRVSLLPSVAQVVATLRRVQGRGCGLGNEARLSIDGTVLPECRQEIAARCICFSAVVRRPSAACDICLRDEARGSPAARPIGPREGYIRSSVGAARRRDAQARERGTTRLGSTAEADISCAIPCGARARDVVWQADASRLEATAGTSASAKQMISKDMAAG